MTFDQMNLIAPLLAAVKKSGYTQPTPIQEAAISLILEGRDVLGCAQTGTGKTAAFALPILQRLAAGPRPRGHRPIRALVLAPTRELAQQNYECFLTYGQKLGLHACVVFGGVSQQGQTDSLARGVDILVATPGRLNDLIGQGYIDLKDVCVFVLDEADRMLDMGFIHDVKRVVAQLPEKRQTLLFSATMPPEVETLAVSMLRDPATVKVDPVTSTVERIRQTLYMIDKANKKYLLAQILNRPDVENALVFVRTRHGADRVVKELSREGIESRAIHGDKSQCARQEALNLFKSGKMKVLVATDIAARGIDIQGLSHVVNYDIPNEPEAYIHRIGRTGRAGLDGDAISFCCIDEMNQLHAVEKLIGERIPRGQCDWPMQVFEPTVKPPRPPRVKDVDRNGNAVVRPPQRRYAAPGQARASAGSETQRGKPNAPAAGSPRAKAAPAGRPSAAETRGKPTPASKPSAAGARVKAPLAGKPAAKGRAHAAFSPRPR